MVINSNIKLVDNLIYTLNSFGEFWIRLFTGVYSIVIFIINFIFFIYRISQLGMDFWYIPKSLKSHRQCTKYHSWSMFVWFGCGNWGSFLPLFFLLYFLFLLWFCFFLNDLGCCVPQKICLVYNWFVQSTRLEALATTDIPILITVWKLWKYYVISLCTDYGENTNSVD